MSFLKSIISRKLFWLAFVYLALLIWSGTYRYQIPKPDLPKTKNSVTLNSVVGDQRQEREIRFAYQDIGEDAESGRVPIILVHGSPGSSEAFDDLAKLITDRRVISVDLPGFGDSESTIPDYSILAHSEYLRAFMDKLKIEKAHFVGFSLGGGVILHLADKQPERVESVTFISSIGVQEYELLGNFYANRIVHAAQLGFFWFLQNLTPHFGMFDGMMMSYAKNFYDTDQRYLREILEKVDTPFLILHGKDDPLVPVEAAREHARIVPQSEYHELNDNHFFVFMRPEKIEKTLKNFWTRTENGEAKTRTNADPDRIARTKEPFEAKILEAKGATMFVFLLLIVFVAFVNEDFSFFLAGFLAGQGRFGPEFAIIAGMVGTLFTIFLMLLAGRFFGKGSVQRSGLSKRYFKDLLEKTIKRKFFRFRFLAYFETGKRRQGFWKYLLFFFTSTIPWALILTSASYLLAKIFY